MLDIFGFSEAKEEELFSTVAVVQAINKLFPSVVFPIQQMPLLEDKGLIELDRMKGLTNQHLNMANGSIGLAMSSVALDETYITKKHALKVIELISCSQPKRDFPEPKVIKSKPETLDAWVLWYIEHERGLNPKDELHYECQRELIDAASSRLGYGESSIRNSWHRVGLKSVHKTRNKKK